MRIPNCKDAIVPPEKIEAYLLNPDHPDGGSKARFFLQVGFDKEALGDVLKLHILTNDFVATEANPYGTKYVVEAQIESPSGFLFNLQSVWIIHFDSSIPILITAYPSK